MSDHRQLTSKEVRASVMRCFAVKRPAFLWGPPGIGKSELVESITEDLGGVMYDLRLGQMEPTDIRGIPFFNQDDAVMDWAQPVDLPQGEQLVIDAIQEEQLNIEVETGTRIKDMPIVVLFLDEMNSAPPSVLAAAYQLILNRRVGKYRTSSQCFNACSR